MILKNSIIPVFLKFSTLVFCKILNKIVRIFELGIRVNKSISCSIMNDNTPNFLKSSKVLRIFSGNTSFNNVFNVDIIKFIGKTFIVLIIPTIDSA